MNMRHRISLVGTALALCVYLLSGVLVQADESYGSGTYGSCQYGSCSITSTSNGTVNVDVIPATGTTCTVSSDTVGVTTDSSTGYTLSLADSDTSTNLSDGAGHTIAGNGGRGASPLRLTANSWGYRVDGVLGFGAGPTSAETNGAIPTPTFATPPLSTGTADTIATSSGPADPTVNTTVWFGVCVSTAKQSGTYTDGVTYTAVLN